MFNLNHIYHSLLVAFLLTLSTNSFNAQVSSNAAHFDGNDIVNIGDHSDFDLQANTSTTFEGWIRFCNDGVVFSKNWCSGQAGYYFRVLPTGQMRFHGLSASTCNGTPLLSYTSTQQYAFNTWHHFVITAQSTSTNTTFAVRMNGVQIMNTTVSGFLNNSTEALVLGAYKNISGNYGFTYVGDIDEFRIYNTVLPTNQMGLAVPPLANLVLHYEMEPQATISSTEPNLGSLGAAFNGSNVVLANPNSTLPIAYTVAIAPIFLVDLGPDTLVNCNVSSILLSTPNNAPNYIWYDSIGSNWNTIPSSNSNSLNYGIVNNAVQTVVVEGALINCIESDTIVITSQNPINIDLGSDTSICAGQNILIDPGVTNGSFLWQDGTTNATLLANVPGQYWVQYTSNGCVSSDTILISQSSFSFTLGNDTTLCPSQTLVLIPSSGTPITWQDGTSGASFTANGPGQYWAVADSSGCISTDTLTITQPTFIFTLGNDTTLCPNQTLALSPSSGIPITWQDGTSTASFTANGPGQYWVLADSSGCLASDSINITYDILPTIQLGNDTTLCINEAINLSFTSTNADQFIWSTGSTDSVITTNNTTLYSIIGSNACGQDSDSLLITFVPPTVIDIGSDTSLCLGSTLVLNAFDPSFISYSWQDGTNTSTYTVNTSGQYIVQAFNGFCMSSASIHVNYLSNQSASLGDDFIICEDTNFILSLSQPLANSSYTWNTGSSEPSISITEAGTYWVAVSNLCGTFTDSVEVELENCNCDIYVPNSFTPDGNEYNNTFGVVTECIVDYFELVIYNRWGEKIFSSFDQSINWDGTYLGRPVPDGIYTYKVTLRNTDDLPILYHGHVNIIR